MSEQKSAFDQLSRLHALLHEEIRGARTWDRRIKIASLVLSVLTACSLWVLFSEYLPDVAQWVGAICATVLAVLSAIESSSLGPSRRLEKLLPQFEEQATAIGRFRDGEPVAWVDYKRFLADMEKLGVSIAIGPPVKTADELAAMTEAERLNYQQEVEQSVVQ